MTATCLDSPPRLPGVPITAIAGELCLYCEHPTRLHSPDWGCRVGKTEQATPTEKRAVYCGCRGGVE
jgi:hypothetical protein